MATVSISMRPPMASVRLLTLGERGSTLLAPRFAFAFAAIGIFAVRGRLRLAAGRRRVGSRRGGAAGRDTLPDPDVIACIQGELRTLTFPRPEGGLVTVVYPMAFDAGD